MYDYSFSQWLLFFYVYCFFGWCFESTVVSIKNRKFVNRGFLDGPVIPIYGSGAILILFAVLPVRNYMLCVFVFGALVATALEYVTGYAMEAIFKVRYWDYTGCKWNVHGYICAKSTLCWGALSVLLIRVIHLPVEQLVLALHSTWCSVISFVCTVFFVFDFATSVKTALDLRNVLIWLENYSVKAKENARLLQKRLEVAAAFERDTLERRVEEQLNKMPDGGEALLRRLEALEELTQKLEQTEPVRKLRGEILTMKIRRNLLRESIQRAMTGDKRRMLRNNPTASSRRYANQLQQLRQDLEQRQAHRREKKHQA